MAKENSKIALVEAEPGGIPLDTVYFHGPVFVQPYGSVKRLALKEQPGIGLFWMPDHVLVKTKNAEVMFDHSATAGCVKAK